LDFQLCLDHCGADFRVALAKRPRSASCGESAGFWHTI
jgi:hypothetical protein